MWKKEKKNAIQFPGSFFVLVFDPLCVNSVKIPSPPAWTYWLLHCSLQYLIIQGLKTKQVDIAILTLYLFVNLFFFNCICNLKQKEAAKIWREKQTLIRVVNQNKTKTHLNKNLMQNKNKVKFFSPAKEEADEHLRALVVFNWLPNLPPPSISTHITDPLQLDKFKNKKLKSYVCLKFGHHYGIC